MFFGFFIRTMINGLILYASVHMVSRKGSKPEFHDVFFVALGITIVSMLLFFALFPSIGYLFLIPAFAANILILMRFLGMSILTAVIVIILYEVINLLLPF
ncbi:MAG: hypothetical protein GF388_01705 [Candidatus Aegiribacteria sp.]|nr:hypothetical protein [Candidatus Aegiribacteria sp.]MBD3294089.1 hypothetical protein [Candidatus Fermentibacteria bacterium]